MTKIGHDSIFHLAIPVHNLDEAREFYGNTLGCPEGRSSSTWVDFDFQGHQLVAHLKETASRTPQITNDVDKKDIPVPHFGLVLEWGKWHGLKEKLVKASVDFIVAPYIRFSGLPGEQATMFLRDPSGNALEFKSFKDPSKLFAK